MSVVAVFVGGPLDGEKRELPDHEARMYYDVQRRLDPAWMPNNETSEDIVWRVRYTHRRFLPQPEQAALPFTVYAEESISNTKMMERLFEHYAPQQDE